MISRRNTFRFIATLPLLTLAGPGSTHTHPTSGLQHMLDIAKKDPAVSRLGQAALASTFKSFSRADLEVELGHCIGDVSGWSRANIAQIVSNQVTRDFQSGSVIRVDGWRVSRTEALVAALSSSS